MPSEQRGSRGTRKLAAIASVIAAAALLWLFARSPSTPTSSGPTANATDGAPLGAPSMLVATPSSHAAKASGSSSGGAGPTEAEVLAFRKWRIDALKEAAKYPGYSKPLTPRHYDALTRVEPQVNKGGPKEGENEREDALLVQPGKLTYQTGEKPLMFVEVINGKTGKRSPLKVSAILMRIVVNGADTPGAIGDMSFRDDGVEGDELPGDLRYTGTPLPSQLATMRGQIHVDVRVTLADGRERHVLSSFRYGSPGAQLTGEFVDYLKDGHLMLEARIEVTKPGRYHVQGGLVGPGGESAVWSQVAAEVKQTGATTITLKFFGLAFLQADVAGPYTLRFISIAETGMRPVAQGPVLENAHVTRAYKLADFSSSPNNDPAMQDIIGQAENLAKEPVSGAAPSGGPKSDKPEKPKPPTEPPPGYDPKAEE